MYIYKYQDDGDYTKFELTAKTSISIPYWLAIGFSDDQEMVNFVSVKFFNIKILFYQGEDSVVMCKYHPNGPNSVEQYYDIPSPGKDINILDKDDVSVGISQPEVRVEDSFFYCNFKRKKAVPGYEFYFDLSKSYYLFAAFGKLNPGKYFNKYNYFDKII